MREIGTYLIFDGNCADAMRFYEKTLGGKLELMTNAQAPESNQMSGDPNRILHARLESPGGLIMASDNPENYPYEKMNGFSISLSYDTAEEGKRVFDALAKDGKVNMPYGPTFWADGFGMLVDRFGTPWFVGGGNRVANA